jgi:hypothetical protein
MPLILSAAKGLSRTREILCRPRFSTIPFLVTLLLPPPGSAQSVPWIRLGAHGIALYTFADPVPHGGTLGEVRLVQPTIMAHAGAFSNRLRFTGTLELEGLTIPNGELTPGTWGEGFMDRRHPHTYVHELMLSANDLLGGKDGPVRLSISAGKGFAPFGTDDPMSRPIVRFPVNHHLAQILERAVIIAGVDLGGVIVEGSVFNGDEPEKPDQSPNFSRFGDSWSGRLTVVPHHTLELQGSLAEVSSPEHRQGAGTDQDKWSISGRWASQVKGYPVYALAELARTSEAEGTFVFHSFLAEGAVSRGHSRLHYRFERTERPEEERTLDPFRSVRPHFENSIQGTTRWTIHTLGYGLELGGSLAALRLAPVVEVSYGRMADVGGGLFDVESFYGGTSFWSLSVGFRLNPGMRMHRMGRYGVLQDTAGDGKMQQHEHHAH